MKGIRAPMLWRSPIDKVSVTTTLADHSINSLADLCRIQWYKQYIPITVTEIPMWILTKIPNVRSEVTKKTFASLCFDFALDRVNVAIKVNKVAKMLAQGRFTGNIKNG
jgi:hypothetical protein